MENEPVWLRKDAVLALHDRQLAEHGGLPGVRDDGLLESALARPQNAHAYGQGDFCALAAAYAFGIAKNHPFFDANKRTAYVSCEMFLALNKFDLLADDAACVIIMLQLAEGLITEEAFADWLRGNTRTCR